METTLLFTFMSLAVMTSAAPTCPLSWTAYGVSCYKLVTVKLPWSDAQVICKLEGGFLISIESKDEDDFAVNLARSRGVDTWIGLNDRDQEGRFVGENNKSPFYTNWAPGQPDNYQDSEDCADISLYNNYLWNDQDCKNELSAICEKEPARKG